MSVNKSFNSVNAEISTVMTKGLVDLLLSYGCPEVSCVPSSGTLPRRKGSQALPSIEKLPSSII